MTKESGSVVRKKSKDLLVSVIIPVYQVSDYVERCLLSVMNQTYQNIECIIVDDCSTDDSIDKCERLLESYNGPIKFTILHHKQNRGLSAARNSGTNAAAGEYIFYLDSDDELTTECLEQLANPIFNNNNIEMVMGYYESIYENVCDKTRVHDKRLQLCEKHINSLDAVRDYFFDNKGNRWFPVTAWNKLIRRDFIERNQISFIEGVLFEDCPWIYSIVKHLCQLYLVPKVTYLYTIRQNSICTGTNKQTKALNYGRIFESIALNFTLGEEAREAAFYLKRFCYLYVNCPECPSYPSAAVYFKKALSDNNHKKERILLFFTEQASRTAVGRHLYKTILMIRRTVVSLF